MKQAKTTKQPLEDSFLYTVTNIDGVAKHFISDESFLEYVKAIYKENEEGQPYPSEIHWLPENIQQAKEYIHEYCSDLTLEEHSVPDSKEGLHTQNEQWNFDNYGEHYSFYSNVKDSKDYSFRVEFSEQNSIAPDEMAKLIIQSLNERKALLNSNNELISALEKIVNDFMGKVKPETYNQIETAINNAKNI